MVVDSVTFSTRGKSVTLGKQRKQPPLEKTTPPTWEELAEAFASVETLREELAQAKETVKDLQQNAALTRAKAQVKEFAEQLADAETALSALGKRIRSRRADTGEG